MDVKRVCMVTIHSDPLEPLGSEEAGGQNVYVKEISKELAALGIEVDVYTRMVGKKPRIEQICPNARVIRINCGSKSKIKKEDLYIHLNDFLSRTRKFIRKNKIQYDVVHGHYWMSATVSVDLAKELRLPHVQIYHSLGKLKQQVLDEEEEYNYRIRILNEQRSMDNCTAIVTESQVEKDQIVEYYGVDPEKIKVIHGGVTRKFTPLDKKQSRKELGIPDGLMVLYLGRITPRKGSRYFVEAIPEILERSKEDVMFYMVGGKDLSIDTGEGFENKERKIIKDIIKKNNIGDNVTFTGPVDNDITPKYYSSADVIVIPSLYEPFGLVAVEAFGCGLPIVATNLGGLSDTVDDGVNGYLVPPKDSKAIADKVSKLLGDPEIRRRFSENGAKKIDEKYRWDVIASQTRELYSGLEYAKPEPEPKKPMVLFATDLDGTLIDDGSENITDFIEQLKNFAEKNDIIFKLVYNTNRSLNLADSSFKLINDHKLPWPDYLIASVGTELYFFDGYFKYDLGWNKLMAKTWDKNRIAQLKISSLEGISLIEPHQQYKISYRIKKLNDLRIIGQIMDLFVEEHVKVVFSQKRHIDIIPKNAGKGKCLQYLAKKIGIPKKNVIVFGNDASDLDAFSSGFGYNVLIGSADKPVKIQFMEVCTEERYITKKKGAAGVIEGVLHFLPYRLPKDELMKNEFFSSLMTDSKKA